MIPTKLKLQNFTSYGTDVPELDFNKFHLAAISGLNGAGKSSLLDSITWCIWGTSRLGDNADSLIHSGAQSMSVELEFLLDGHKFIVKRIRSAKSGGSTSLEFLSGTHNLTEGTIKSTQAKIIDTLHLSFETFTNSAFLRQGHADEFTTKGPTERKRILADILGLAHYDLLEEKVKEKIKDIQANLQRLEYQVLEIEAELTQKEERSEKKKLAEENLLKLGAEIKELEIKLKDKASQKETLNLANEQKAKLEQNYLANKKELDEIILQGKSRKEKIDQITKQLESLKDIDSQLSEFKDLETNKSKLEKAKTEKLEMEKKISVIQGKLDLKKQQTEQLRREIEKLENQLTESVKTGAKCPTCGQEIGKTEKDHVKNELSGQIEKLKKELTSINSEEEEKEKSSLETLYKNIDFDEGKYLQITTKLLDLERLQKQKEQKVSLTATLETEQKVVVEMRTLYANKSKQVEAQKKEMEKYPDLSNQLNFVNKEISETENLLSQKRQEEKEASGILGQINELISRTAQLEKTQKIKNDEKISLKFAKEAHEELALAFGKKGIQTMIIETAIPEIEDEANRLLDKLSDGRMKIRLETQRKTKTKVSGGEKGIVETLDIIISDEMGERPYEAYSGGEQFRVNFAIRLALSKLLTHRAGAKLQFLVVDEGFGTQDAQGRSRIIEAIDAIKNDFEKILVITHLEELKEEFPVRIEVSKGATGSTFKVIGV